MTVSRTFRIALIGAVLVAIAYVLDVLVGVDFGSSTRGLTRLIVLLGAVLCTGALYQDWSVIKGHVVRDHAAVAAALVGGALVASSVVGTSVGHVFSNDITATAGLLGLVVALYLNRASTLEKAAAR
jgi:hypothetical protein